MNYLLYISFILFNLLAWAQDGKVTLSIEPSSAEVGETVLIKIKSQVEGDIDIDNLPSSFVHGYQTMQGMESEMDTYTGDLITYYYFHQTGAFGKEGKYTVGPVYVKKGHKTYKSNTVTVTIGKKPAMKSGDITDQQLQDPAFGIIQTNKTTIYEGEPLLLSAKVYAKFNPTYLDSYQAYSMKGAIDKHGIGNNSNPQTKRDHFRSLDLYSFEYDRNVIFPVGTGDFNIDGFSMKLYQGYQNFTLTSNDIQITIKPLPSNPPADFIGAVGRFDIDRIVEDNGLKQGDVFKMKIIVSGAGNLQNITEPRPILPKGFVIYGDPIIEESFNYTSNGAEGEISFEYNVQVSKYGDINLPATSISYFDTNKEKYVSVSSEEDNLKVKEDKNFVLQETELDENESIEELNILDDLRPSEVIASTDSYYGTSLFWGGVGAPILAALLFLFITKRKENSQQELEEKQDIINQVNVIGQAVSELKVLAVSDNRYEFFSKTEYILLTAMKVLAKQSGVEYSGRADLLSHLEKSGEIELKNSINKILQQCDESRFALSSNQTELAEILKEVEQIVQRFNS